MTATTEDTAKHRGIGRPENSWKEIGGKKCGQIELEEDGDRADGCGLCFNGTVGFLT